MEDETGKDCENMPTNDLMLVNYGSIVGTSTQS